MCRVNLPLTLSLSIALRSLEKDERRKERTHGRRKAKRDNLLIFYIKHTKQHKTTHSGNIGVYDVHNKKPEGNECRRRRRRKKGPWRIIIIIIISRWLLIYFPFGWSRVCHAKNTNPIHSENKSFPPSSSFPAALARRNAEQDVFSSWIFIYLFTELSADDDRGDHFALTAHEGGDCGKLSDLRKQNRKKKKTKKNRKNKQNQTGSLFPVRMKITKPASCCGF